MRGVEGIPQVRIGLGPYGSRSCARGQPHVACHLAAERNSAGGRTGPVIAEVGRHACSGAADRHEGPGEKGPLSVNAPAIQEIFRDGLRPDLLAEVGCAIAEVDVHDVRPASAALVQIIVNPTLPGIGDRFSPGVV